MMSFFFFLLLSALNALVSGTTPEAIRGPGATGRSDTPHEEPRIVIVVSRNNPVNSLTSAELSRIYLRKKTRWSHGESITVFERPTRTEIRQKFSRKVLGKNPHSLREYWMNLKLTRGLKPPKVLRSAKLVRLYLARVKGGIGYLHEDEVDETVKVLRIVWKTNP